MHPVAEPSPRLRRVLTRVLALGALLAWPAAPTAAPFQGFNPSGEQSLPSTSGDFLKDWHWWWHFNREQYLNLREVIFKGSPRTGGRDFFLGIGEREIVIDPTKLSPYELRVQIVPALMAAIENEDAPGGLLQAALMALAKIGPDGELADGDPFDEIFLAHLTHDSIGVRERAVLALGVFGRTDSVPILIELLNDSHAAQRLLEKTEVPRKMRAYAAYSLGLIGARNEDTGMRRAILAELVDVLEGPKFATRDIKTACMNAFGLMPLDVREWEEIPKRVGTRPLPRPDPLKSRQGQLRWLLRYLDDFRINHELIRAHVPIALLRLLPGADPRMKEEVADPLLKLVGRYANERSELQQSCLIALGEIGDLDADDVDRDIVKTLERMVQKGDQVSRRFALMGLGRIGASPGRGEAPFASSGRVLRALLRELSSFGESRQHAWAALGLGVMLRELADARQPMPAEPLEPLRKALFKCRTPLDIGAYSLALGLARDIESLEVLETKLELFNIEGAKGLVALAMGMVGHRDAEEPLLAILRDSEFRGEQMELTSIALALLGSEERLPLLEELLAAAGSEASRGPIVAALGRSGDRRSIPTLVEILSDLEDTTQGLLTAAAVALGNIADKDKILWRATYSTNVNYAATPTSLFGGGILDVF